MLQSHPIVIDGVFVGAAVRLDTGYRFVATDSRLEDLDGTTWPALEDVRARASRLWRTGPSVPMMMRHLPPGSLDPEVLKDRLSHAYARHRNLCRGRCRVERRP